jgi:EAL and modified HD-GYP domain-containing signal transduction protein
MDVTIFLGRQPIFDRRQNVFGYELLYRDSGERNVCDRRDGDGASRAVINNSMNVLPLTDLVGERRAFINLTRQLLLDGTYAVLPRQRAVLEVLENVVAEEAVLNACHAAKQAGYLLALDDFVLNEESRPLVQYADILKIDFIQTEAETRRRLADSFGGGKLMLLAEKVETREQFEEALQLGYSFFQGYFFCKPEILSGRDVPAIKHNYLRFIQLVNRSPLDYARLEETIKHEVSLSTKLFRYISSASLGVRNRLRSIRQALALLGERTLRKWASVVALSALAEDKPAELLVTCLSRARFCESLCTHIGLRDRELDLFLMGLFSAMDAMMDQPLEMLMSQIPVPDDVSAALLGADTALGRVYRLALCFERGNSMLIDMTLQRLGLPTERTVALYCDALKWADQGVVEVVGSQAA